jgi:hypothetical protein
MKHICTDFEISDHIKNYQSINQQELGHYCAGLMEADGYFGPSNIEIVLHAKDTSAAYALRSGLGYGSVYNVKDKNAVKFVISNRAGRGHLLNLVNGKLVGLAKVEQLLKHNYGSQFNVAILPPKNVIDWNTHWLAGFLDGDGSICIFIADSKTHKHKKSARLEIKFTQKNPLLLRLIADLFHVNAITKSNKAIHYLKITGIQRLKAFLVYLDRYQLRTKKYVQYIIFRRAYRYMIAKKHLHHDGLDKISRFKISLQKVYK